MLLTATHIHATHSMKAVRSRSPELLIILYVEVVFHGSALGHPACQV